MLQVAAAQAKNRVDRLAHPRNPKATTSKKVFYSAMASHSQRALIASLLLPTAIYLLVGASPAHCSSTLVGSMPASVMV